MSDNNVFGTAQKFVYLDHAATTPVDPEVIEAIIPCYNEIWGNASSIYSHGQRANLLLQQSRREIAQVLNCHPEGIIFTSGGTESDNLALKGVALQTRLSGKPAHIITTNFEHHAISHTCQYLAQFGVETTYISVNSQGLVDPAAIERAIRPGETVLVSIMYANNEIGTVQPLAEISEICRKHSVLFHTDAVQVPGYLNLDVEALGVDLLSLSSHKFYGPKGCGLLYVRRGVSLQYQQQGGGQEGQRRAGTENLPGIVGTAKALVKAERERLTVTRHVAALRNRLWQGIKSSIADVAINGSLENRLASNLNICLRGVENYYLLQELNQAGIAVSSGSACSAGGREPSHVLKAIGVVSLEGVATIRFSLGKHTTAAEIDYVLEVLPTIVEKLRAGNAVAA